MALEVHEKVAETYGKENVIVRLGAPVADSSEIYAETISHGDQTWASPLSGITLSLLVYRIMEPKIKKQIETVCFKERLALMEIALDADAIGKSLKKVREE